MGATVAVHPTDPILQAYGLGKLDDVSSASVIKHLESCNPCQRRVAELSSDEFLGRLQKVGVMPDKAASGWSPSAASSTEGAARPVAPPPPVDTLPPELVDHADYEIVRELGRGGMGVVYLANNRLMGRPEVLKVVGHHLIERPGVADRFLREIRSAAKLHHTNIVTAHSAIRVGESLMLAMEYVEGLDLAKMVKTKGPLPIAHACNFIYQAALGLQHAHERGMVHRDIKPANLILARDGKKAVVKVLDFGLAKVTSEGQIDSNLTREGQMLGTPDYIAPEQIRDAQSADIRADVYSLGCTFYYLLTGGPPFRGDHLWDLYQAHFSMDAQPLNLIRPEVPVELNAVVAKMMAKEQGRRFQTPGDVARALAPFFKPALTRPGVSNAELPRFETQVAPTQPASADIAPSQPATLASAAALIVQAAPKSLASGVAWDSLIDTREVEQSVVAVPTVFRGQRPRWLWPSASFGVLALGICAAWMSGVFIKVHTPDGVIVLENVPNDSEILVDGIKITFTWPGVGKSLEIRAVPGQHKVQLKKDGTTTFDEEVEIDAGGRQSIKVRLEPLPVAAARPADASDPVDKPPAASLDVKVRRADYDAIATGKWISGLAGKNDLDDRLLFIPEQRAGDVIIRAKVKKVTGQNLAIGLRRDENRPRKRGYGAYFNGGDWFGIWKFGEVPKDLRQFRTATSFEDHFEFAFSAVGDILTVYVDGKRIGEARDPDYRLGSLSIHALHGRSLFQNVEVMILDRPVPPDDDTGFKPLFNGKDLKGWKPLLENGSEWRVNDDGVLEGRGGGKGCPAVLVSERQDFTNFRLRAKVRYPVDSHGWIEVRRSATQGGSNGYFVYQGVWPTPTESVRPVGSVANATDYRYGSFLKFQLEAEPTSFETNTWYTIEISVNKNILTTSANGKRLSDYIDTNESYSSGAIALVCRGDAGPVQFQEITIEELPD